MALQRLVGQNLLGNKNTPGNQLKENLYRNVSSKRFGFCNLSTSTKTTIPHKEMCIFSNLLIFRRPKKCCFSGRRRVFCWQKTHGSELTMRAYKNWAVSLPVLKWPLPLVVGWFIVVGHLPRFIGDDFRAHKQFHHVSFMIQGKQNMSGPFNMNHSVPNEHLALVSWHIYEGGGFVH